MTDVIRKLKCRIDDSAFQPLNSQLLRLGWNDWVQ